MHNHFIRLIHHTLLFISLWISFTLNTYANTAHIPSDRLLTDDELISFLASNNNPELKDIASRYKSNKKEGLIELAHYFKEVFGERYYFHWKDVNTRFIQYQNDFRSAMDSHIYKSNIHLSLYPAHVQWQRPFKNLLGRDVSAYELRHLARQHKVRDMAYAHLADNRNPKYVNYFTTQMRSLNMAFSNKAYDDDNTGNGVFERYRAGTRVISWLEIHALYLDSPDYTWRDQIDFLRSMLLEGAILNKKNQKFKKGNHQTRGMNALAMLSILFKEYTSTDIWYQQAMTILEQHLEREVNPDGFQFERSIHYHIDDIYNYFYAYQLAKLNQFTVSDTWKLKLKAMFDAMVKMGRPDKKLPVSSDDTKKVMSENNLMDGIMLLGAILFNDPKINYFAATRPTSKIYWYLNDTNFEQLSSLKKMRPENASQALPDTGFYIMRDGWKDNSLYMNISAGKSLTKPDHQHGDMLGLSAFGRQNELLPNYQVTYSMDDLRYFKNSFSKNVALIDNRPQGQNWKSNAGGSGFGKWKQLPTPTTINWTTNDTWDYFVGTHDGFKDSRVQYFRKVIFLKNLGWIVKDIFEGDTKHNYQQIWQGHYSQISHTGHHFSSFANGSGLEILHLGDMPTHAQRNIKLGKGSLSYSRYGINTEYTTFLYPYQSLRTRLPKNFPNTRPISVNQWQFQKNTSQELMLSELTVDQKSIAVKSDAQLSISKNTDLFLFNVRKVSYAKNEIELEQAIDLHIKGIDKQSATITLLSHQAIDITSTKGGLRSATNEKLSELTSALPGNHFTLTNK